jgi:hypothetical protein
LVAAGGSLVAETVASSTKPAPLLLCTSCRTLLTNHTSLQVPVHRHCSASASGSLVCHCFASHTLAWCCLWLLLLLQVVIADDRQAGYFAAIWRRLAWPHPLRILRQQPYSDNTCFAHAIIAPYAAHAQSLLTYKAGSVDEVLCESVVLQAASRWLRHLFRDLLPPTHRHAAAFAAGRQAKPRSTPAHLPDSDVSSDGSGDSSSGPQQGPMFLAGTVFRDLAPLEPGPTQSAAPLELLYVVWLSRRRYEQQHNATLTDWQKARVLSAQQQEEVVLALQRAVLQWNEQTCKAAGQSGCHARHVMFSLQVSQEVACCMQPAPTSSTWLHGSSTQHLTTSQFAHLTAAAPIPAPMHGICRLHCMLLPAQCLTSLVHRLLNARRCVKCLHLSK